MYAMFLRHTISCDQSDGTPCRGRRSSLHTYLLVPSHNSLLSSSITSGGAAHPFFLSILSYFARLSVVPFSAVSPTSRFPIELSLT